MSLLRKRALNFSCQKFALTLEVGVQMTENTRIVEKYVGCGLLSQKPTCIIVELKVCVVSKNPIQWCQYCGEESSWSFVRNSRGNGLCDRWRTLTKDLLRRVKDTYWSEILLFPWHNILVGWCLNTRTYIISYLLTYTIWRLILMGLDMVG